MKEVVNKNVLDLVATGERRTVGGRFRDAIMRVVRAGSVEKIET